MSKYDIPYKKIIGDFVIDILTPNDIDVDFETCVENEIHLHGLFGDEWPHNLTRDEDLLDLYWHYQCFIWQKEFAWTIKLKNDTEYLSILISFVSLSFHCKLYFCATLHGFGLIFKVCPFWKFYKKLPRKPSKKCQKQPLHPKRF